jgi:hypothetical protein
MKPISCASPATWKQRYESLRDHVVEGRRSLGADPLGLVLLCGQGLAGWMRGWREVIVPTPCSSLVLPELLSPMTPLWQQQLTLLLAQMTSQHLPALTVT